MKDDYLWDGSGEGDPEIEELEQLLGQFRGRSEAPALPAPKRRVFGPALMAAAAALAVGVGSAVWVTTLRSGEVETQPALQADSGPSVSGEGPAVANTVVPKELYPINQPPVPAPDRPKIRTTTSKPAMVRVKSAAPAATAAPALATAETYRAPRPAVDLMTAMHIEQAQLLLRSFRNIPASDAAGSVDVSYDRKQSRELLVANVALRRAAARKGNLPVEELLDDVELNLREIANLDDSARPEDVRDIQSRLTRQQLVAELGLYASNAHRKTGF